VSKKFDDIIMRSWQRDRHTAIKIWKISRSSYASECWRAIAAGSSNIVKQSLNWSLASYFYEDLV